MVRPRVGGHVIQIALDSSSYVTSDDADGLAATSRQGPKAQSVGIRIEKGRCVSPGGSMMIGFAMPWGQR
jgi:hypothetical protein